MPELYIIKDGRTIDQRTLGSSNLTIGRGTESALRLDSGLVSRNHAEIRFEGGQFAVQDLKSGNGVFVNGVREYHRVLRPDDRVEIGGFILLYSPSSAASIPPRAGQVATAPAPRPPAPGLAEGDVGSGATMNIDAGELARLMAQKREQLEPRFEILLDHGVKTYTLKKEKYVVGFSRDSDLRLPGPDGPKLFLVTRRGNEVDVKALGWFTKIEVNGQRGRKFALSHGDEINARGTVVTYKAGGRA